MKDELEYIFPEMDDENILEHYFYMNLRNEVKPKNKKHELTVGRIVEIPLYSYTRLLKYKEGVGINGVHYKVRYSYKGKIKDKIITRSRFIKAYNKWIRKCWINEWENNLGVTK